MSVEIISQAGDELTLQININLGGSMLEAEDKIVSACKAGLIEHNKSVRTL